MKESLRKIRNKIRSYYWIKFKPRSNKEVIIKRYKVSFNLDLSKDVDYRFYLNIYEKRELKFMRKILKTGMTFFDIGANIGIYSLIAAKILKGKGDVHAFEPAPNAFAKLKFNVNLNHFDNIECNNVAVNDTIGEAKFNICQDDAYNSLTSDTYTSIVDQIVVRTVTLDDYVQKNNTNNINLIKIDTEGVELQVLKGGLNILKNQSPTILFEYNRYAKDKNDDTIFNLLFTYGYKFYYLKKNKLLLLDLRNIRTSSIIAIKNTNSDLERNN